MNTDYIHRWTNDYFRYLMFVFHVPYIDIVQEDQIKYYGPAPYRLQDTTDSSVDDLSYEDRMGIIHSTGFNNECIGQIFRLIPGLYGCANSNSYQVYDCDKIFGIGRIYPTEDKVNMEDYLYGHILYILNTCLKEKRKDVYEIKSVKPASAFTNVNIETFGAFNDMIRQEMYNIGIEYVGIYSREHYATFKIKSFSESIEYICSIDATLYQKYKPLLYDYEEVGFEVFDDALELGLL